MFNWYLVQFKPNHHRVAERNLNQQGFKTFLPLQETTSRGVSKFTTCLKPLFPGYMFVSIELDRSPWRKINSTLGVVRLICQDGLPKRLPFEIVSGLMSRCDRIGKLLPTKSLETGDPVTVVSGALTNFVATVETIDSKRRIWILMDILGHRTKVQVGFEQLKLLS